MNTTNTKTKKRKKYQDKVMDMPQLKRMKAQMMERRDFKELARIEKMIEFQKQKQREQKQQAQQQDGGD